MRPDRYCRGYAKTDRERAAKYRAANQKRIQSRTFIRDCYKKADKYANDAQQKVETSFLDLLLQTAKETKTKKYQKNGVVLTTEQLYCMVYWRTVELHQDCDYVFELNNVGRKFYYDHFYDQENEDDEIDGSHIPPYLEYHYSSSLGFRRRRYKELCALFLRTMTFLSGRKWEVDPETPASPVS